MDYQQHAVDYASIPHSVMFPPAVTTPHEPRRHFTSFISEERSEPSTVTRYAATGTRTNVVAKEAVERVETQMIEAVGAIVKRQVEAKERITSVVASQRAALLTMKLARADSSVETLARLEILNRRMESLAPRVHPSQVARLEEVIGSLERSKAVLAEIDLLLDA
ncbi:hypothetical protein ARC20_03065 [Stenotrophomonas panacihumi]|uniref:Uncharacterized protein n=1 Tax=Stenotrophomonas panacihumi TaxID=676599 RepID=A0A0R0APZ6_9GAMM|nr:hypothetical protein [Stenotrophomonas panacihumi]KRG47324.1 hypothetical protein ARC20_03065 [Stenotrophomonas panacihumi]PTN55801.1 hypothetical protein C9J98_04305 [Stenotrophomonas panacihumi]